MSQIFWDIIELVAQFMGPSISNEHFNFNHPIYVVPPFGCAMVPNMKLNDVSFSTPTPRLMHLALLAV